MFAHRRQAFPEGGCRLPSVFEFLSAVLLIGVALILPVCIIGSVVRAIRATGRVHQPTR